MQRLILYQGEFNLLRFLEPLRAKQARPSCHEAEVRGNLHNVAKIADKGSSKYNLLEFGMLAHLYKRIYNWNKKTKQTQFQV